MKRNIYIIMIDGYDLFSRWECEKEMKFRLSRKLFLIFLALMMLIPFLAACTKDEGVNTPASESSSERDRERKRNTNERERNTPRTLRFATGYEFGQNGEIYREFTELFEFSHDHIELEYLETVDQSYYGGNIYLPPEEGEEPDPLEALKKAMTGPTPPDIVMIDYSQLAELANENLLVSLDELVLKESRFNLDDFVPAVIDGLRKPGNGTLYALAPQFFSSAVIYNKQLFLDRGVPFPTDGMTWQEMFELARRVSVDHEDKPVYGFGFNTYFGDGGPWNLFHNMNQYVRPLGLKWVDDESLKMTANTDAWHDVWNTMVDLYRDKVLPQEPDWSSIDTNNPVAWDLFLSGQLAMAIVPYSYLTDIIYANQQADRIEGFTPIDWDVVTVPVHPEEPGVGLDMYYNGIFAINARAENLEDAWNFIKFINGEEWARIKSKSSYNLLSRRSYIEPLQGIDYNMDAFLQLSPPEYQIYDSSILESYYWDIINIGQNKMVEVINEGKNIRLALQEWETEGQMIIQQWLENR